MQPVPVNRHGSMLAILCVAAAAISTTAFGWSFPLDRNAPADVRVTIADADATGRIWAVGALDEHFVLLRYNGSGAPTLVQPTDFERFAPLDLVAQDDGGMRLTAVVEMPDHDYASECLIAEYAPDGVLRWSSLLPDCSGSQTPAEPRLVQPDAAGERWVHVGRWIVRFGRDGRVLARLSHDDVSSAELAADTRSGALYQLTAEHVERTVTPLVIARDKRGTETWRWRGIALAGEDVSTRFAVAPDGSLRILVSNPQGAHLVALDETGAQRWTTTTDRTTHSPPRNMNGPVLDAAGASWFALSASYGDPSSVRKVNANGQVVVSLAPATVQLASAADRLAATPDGGLLLSGYGGLVRLDNDGNVRFRRVSSPDAEGFDIGRGLIGFDGAGASLHLRRQDDAAPTNAFLRIGADGRDLPAAQNLEATKAATTADRTLLPDGSQVAWIRSSDGSGSRELIRLDATGGVVWRHATPGVWRDSSRELVRIAGNATRVCTFDAREQAAGIESVVDCYRVDDGSVVWSLRNDAGGSNQRYRTGRIHVDADDTVSIWSQNETLPQGAQLVRIDRSGVVLGATTWPAAVLSNASPHDTSLTLLWVAPDYVLVDAKGVERARQPSYSPPNSQVAFRWTDDGRIVQTRTSPYSNTVVTRSGAAGAQLWSTELAAPADIGAATAVGADAVFVQNCASRDSATERPFCSIERVSLADGSRAWRSSFPLATHAYRRERNLTLTPDGTAVVATGSTPRALTIEVLDARDGRILHSHRLACHSAPCEAKAPLVDANGRVHLLDAGMTGPSALVSWQIPARNSSIRLDQPGIAGAWWSPYANGEGFVLDYLPEARVLFMPWFTFSREGGNDPAGQRWYVVQGSVDADATSVELPITESTGGAFDAGPPVTPTIVGTARLSFTDCDNGTLNYRFDDGRNGGAAGTITLSRLSPATQNCVLADSTVQTRTSTPANGFDARMSGSWFEPATSGQGLQFTVQPGGIFFAPWFAYDPADAADDPGRQRWYTIQGSLGDARNGVVELPIVQTIGGTFDSVPTNNMVIVGKATITMLACDRAKLDYRFDDNELAASMRARTGSIDLVKAGGCTL